MAIVITSLKIVPEIIIMQPAAIAMRFYTINESYQLYSPVKQKTQLSEITY